MMLLYCFCATSLCCSPVIFRVASDFYERLSLLVISGLLGAGVIGVFFNRATVSDGPLTHNEITERSFESDLLHYLGSYIILILGCGGLAVFLLMRLARRHWQPKADRWNKSDGNHYNSGSHGRDG